MVPARVFLLLTFHIIARTAWYRQGRTPRCRGTSGLDLPDIGPAALASRASGKAGPAPVIYAGDGARYRKDQLTSEAEPGARSQEPLVESPGSHPRMPQLRLDDLLAELQARLQTVLTTRDRVHALL